MSRVVVVTGGTSGVGRATVAAFVRHGDRVAVLARGQDALDATRREVEAMGGRSMVISVDVVDADAVEAAAAAVESEIGPIDVWVNVAMTSVFAPFLEIEAREFARVTEVTYLGFVNGTRTALRRMVPRNHGVVVQVGSALAYRSIPLQSAYCGAKHAMQGFTDSVRCELLHERSDVRLSTVHLPAMNTPQFDTVLSRLAHRAQPVAPIYQPEVAAEAVVGVAESGRRQVWVGASAVGAILGNRVIPGLLDRYLGRTGYSAQQADEPADRDRASNLWQPVPGDRGAHGRFDEQAHGRSLQWRSRAALTASRRFIETQVRR